MSESILNALVQLFALIGDIHDDTVISSREKNVIRSFLARQLNNALTDKYMKMFEDYLASYNSERITKGSIQDRKRTSLNAMRILAICEKINEELQQKQKIYVLVQLIEYISLGEEVTENELDFVHTVSTAFYIPDAEFENIRVFIMNSPAMVQEKKNVLVIDNIKGNNPDPIKRILNDNLKGRISFLHIQSTNTYILRYSGGEDIYLNGQNITADLTYFFDNGSTIRATGINPIYYTEVVSMITGTENKLKITLVAEDVTFKFSNSENGIHNLTIHEESGRLVGILGGSGVGKSTTLSILNGTLEPQSGKVTINGFNLYDEEDKKNLSGIIGFVPQDDLLIEELTVFQNLYYNARLCLSNLDEEKITGIVNKTLADFDLTDTRDLKVGSPLKKIISGGQRKRVNIALELMREPAILFVDEPTSGLSSVDSEKVMNLLKEQTYKGRLVIINIHQPGSDIYKMFDKIMIIDKGGYQIYYGNPTEAIVYFKTHSNHANPDEDQCVKCGNINTDQILQIIETKVVDEHGRATQIRRISPVEWASKFRASFAGSHPEAKSEKEPLPENNYSIPGRFRQSVIYFMRDVISKLADRQYIMISMLGPALLALLLAYFTRFSQGPAYVFRDNENVLPYMFMCVITSMFFGLMVSSEEIIKDRKILKRESFLNLSWFSYLNSKIMIMFIISAVQTISFVLIGNLILGIRGMIPAFWLVLFTTSCFANALGLNLSSAFNSVIAIYILIPFIIIPQLLFSGVLVRFDKLHIGKSSPREYVPVIGDLMTARWSYEAMVVKQFRDNEYEKHYFQFDLQQATCSYYNNMVEALNTDIFKYRKAARDHDESFNSSEFFDRLKKNSFKLGDLAGILPGTWKDSLDPKLFTKTAEEGIKHYLDTIRKKFSAEWRLVDKLRDKEGAQLTSSLGNDGRMKLREDHENVRITEELLGKFRSAELVLRIGDKLVQNTDFGYMKGTSPYGRAHFYAPIKRIGNKEIDTFLFDLGVIWIEAILLYIALCFNLPRRFITWLGNIQFRKIDTPQ
ncbi:MAG: ATP-binding cassette domain-containing protein [Bacteroidales bacterium]|jgi:ABC-type multidrug transport system ATPase subunit